MIYQLLAKWLVSWTPIFYLKGVLGGSSHFVSSQDHPPPFRSHKKAIWKGNIARCLGEKNWPWLLTTCPSPGMIHAVHLWLFAEFCTEQWAITWRITRSPQLGDLQSPWLLLTEWHDPPSRWHSSDIFCLPQPPVARFHGILTSLESLLEKKKQVVMNARITRGHQLLCC